MRCAEGDAESAELVSQVRAKVRNIYGAPKAFMCLRALGVCAPRKCVARIMSERVGLHQLIPLSLHCVPYGGTCMPRTLSVGRRHA